MLNTYWDSEIAIFRRQIQGDRKLLTYPGPAGQPLDKTIRLFEMIEEFGNGAWGIGHWALGMGHWGLGIGYWLLQTTVNR